MCGGEEARAFEVCWCTGRIHQRFLDDRHHRRWPGPHPHRIFLQFRPAVPVEASSAQDSFRRTTGRGYRESFEPYTRYPATILRECSHHTRAWNPQQSSVWTLKFDPSRPAISNDGRNAVRGRRAPLKTCLPWVRPRDFFQFVR